MEVSEAVAAVLREASAFEPHAISLLDALGLVLAEDVRADADSPPFDKSLVDGFAVRLADCVASLPVIETVAAGQVPTRSLDRPAAIQIMTGAPLPVGAEAVVPVELTSEQIGASGGVHVSIPIKVASWKLDTNILRRGASTKLGDLVVAAGSELRPQELGALAECGLARVTARRRPRVAVLATGDELVPVEQAPGPGQIRNSNETMLCAQLLRACAEPVPLGIARDERAHLRERIDIGLQSDVLVLSGGVSMGEKDLVPSELAAAGVRQVFHKANVKPGKPIWFGVLDRRPNSRTLVFGLPGNPVSSLVCFELFVRPALRRMMGVSSAESVAVKARLTAPHTTKGERPTYQPARLEWQSDGPIVTAIPWVGSSDLRATVAANSMALFPVGDQTYEAGSVIEVIAW
ncbi:molybdopterin molybdenumtransferase MoeA [Planctomycetia bacterium]|nr:molybdopterin molybdenumtransferase MoeA [Planctomycetia bacterium]